MALSKRGVLCNTIVSVCIREVVLSAVVVTPPVRSDISDFFSSKLHCAACGIIFWGIPQVYIGYYHTNDKGTGYPIPPA